MVKVDVRLYATLRRYGPETTLGEDLTLELPEGTTVEGLLQKLGVPSDVVKIVFVNGISRDPDHVLAEGDRIGIFPPVAGG